VKKPASKHHTFLNKKDYAGLRMPKGEDDSENGYF
jgi:hypothetical protein